jgi:sugar phosphate isomerase/epimerase
MKISCCWLYAISKYGYPPSLADTKQALREMKDLGFTYVELEGVRRENLTEVYQHRQELRALAQDLGLQIVNFCPILPDLVSLDERRRREAVGLFERGIELASFFGCETVQSDSYTPPLEFTGEAPYKQALAYGVDFSVRIDPAFSWPRLWDAVVDSVCRINALAKAAGLKLTMEPRVGEIISNTDALLRLMDAVDDPNFGAVLDTAHQHAQKEILPLSVEKLGERIMYLHVADNDSRVNEHLAVGRGTVDWEGVLAALKKFNFRGYAAIDVGNVPDLDAQYRESVVVLERLATKHRL